LKDALLALAGAEGEDSEDLAIAQLADGMSDSDGRSSSSSGTSSSDGDWVMLESQSAPKKKASQNEKAATVHPGSIEKGQQGQAGGAKGRRTKSRQGADDSVFAPADQYIHLTWDDNAAPARKQKRQNKNSLKAGKGNLQKM
jgi:hypothetical protein